MSDRIIVIEDTEQIIRQAQLKLAMLRATDRYYMQDVLSGKDLYCEMKLLREKRSRLPIRARAIFGVIAKELLDTEMIQPEREDSEGERFIQDQLDRY
jgi:hypothetical protein